MSWLASGKAMAIFEGIRPGEKLVLLALADHHNRETDRCDPSLDTLARDAVMTRKAVIANLQLLQEKGFINIEARQADSGRQISNFYTLAFLGEGRVKKLHSGGVETTPSEGVETTPKPGISGKVSEDKGLAALACSKKDEWLSFLTQLDKGRSQGVLSPVGNPEAYATRCASTGSSPPKGIDFDLLIQVGAAVLLGARPGLHSQVSMSTVHLPKLEVLETTAHYYSRLQQALGSDLGSYLVWAVSQVRLVGSLSDPRHTLHYLTQTGVLPSVFEWRDNARLKHEHTSDHHTQASQPINSS